MSGLDVNRDFSGLPGSDDTGMDGGNGHRTVVGVNTRTPDRTGGGAGHRKLERLTDPVAEADQVIGSGDHIGRNGTGRSGVVSRLTDGATGGKGRDLRSGDGAIVDANFIKFAGEQIEDSPQFGGTVDTLFILGMAKVGESVKILLDIDRVLTDDDLSSLAGVSDNAVTS